MYCSYNICIKNITECSNYNIYMYCSYWSQFTIEDAIFMIKNGFDIINVYYVQFDYFCVAIAILGCFNEYTVIKVLAPIS